MARKNSTKRKSIQLLTKYTHHFWSSPSPSPTPSPKRTPPLLPTPKPLASFPLTIGAPQHTYPPTSLLGCPPEIRNLIYAHFTLGPLRSRSTRGYLSTIQADSPLNPGSELLPICRQTYHEVRGLVSRTVLLTPERIEPTVYRVLPLAGGRLGRVPAAEVKAIGVRDVLIREYWENLADHAVWVGSGSEGVLTRRRKQEEQRLRRWGADEANETEKRLRAGEERLRALALDTVWLTVCCCRGTGTADPWRVNVLCEALQSIVQAFGSVRRVVIYFCGGHPSPYGIAGPGSFTGLAAQATLTRRRGVKQALNIVLESALEQQEDAPVNMPWWVKKKNEGSDWGSLGSEMSSGGRMYKDGALIDDDKGRWEYTMWFPEIKVDGAVVVEEKKVDVEVFDSWTVMRKRCVLH